MATWGVAEAKAKFSAVLDRAEVEGPQLVRRRKQEFYVLTREQMDRRTMPTSAKKPFVNAWDALEPSFKERYDVEFPRVRWKPRKLDL